MPSGPAERLIGIARDISARMRSVAVPDSHFHLDFSQFIPGFSGSAAAAERFGSTALCRGARRIFATPDNGLLPLRQLLLEQGKDLVLPSYGLHRGFILIEAAKVPRGQAVFASWLDGLEHFGRPLSVRELRSRGKFDLILTGASAVTIHGLRFGMGAGYLDVEWGVFAEAELVLPDVPIAALVHDLQVVDDRAPAVATNVLVNYVVTPTRILDCPPAPRPSGLDWSIVGPEIAASPALRELRA